MNLDSFSGVLGSYPVTTRSKWVLVVNQIFGVIKTFNCLRLFLQEIYEQIDKNNDGTIEFEEFVTVLDHPKVNLSR